MRAKFIFFITSILLLSSLLSGCSTKKNTWSTRSYHYVTAKYNVRFNAKQAFMQAEEVINEQHRDNFNEILPIFPISKHDNASLVSSQMQLTQEKCEKTIKLHSIVKKPKRNPSKAKDPAYKAFMSKEEYNPIVQEAWVLLGKSQFYQLDFTASSATFGYVSRHFQDNPELVIEAQLWEARSYAEMGWYYEAEDLLKRMDEKSFTQKTNHLYVLVMADLLLKTEQYAEAIPFLKTAVDFSKRQELTRYAYILGQVYEHQKQYGLAADAYNLVLDHHPLHEMEFNALLSKARCYQGTDTQAILKALERLIKKQSNAPYLDQIYYTIGSLHERHGNAAIARDFYKKAITASTRNGIDKAKALLALGDMYYIDSLYVQAQPLYNEALPIIPADYPDYKELEKRTFLLNAIAKNELIVQLEDSLQHLAQLPKAERDSIILSTIQQRQQAEQAEAARLEEEARQQGLRDQNAALSQMGMSIGEVADKSWYFYNPTLVSRGKIEFQKIWGNRTLEDDWRRSNKIVASTLDEEEYISEEENLAQLDSIDVAQEDATHLTPNDLQYHVRKLPTEGPKLEASNAAIKDALGNLFILYHETMHNDPQAKRVYEQLKKRFPQDLQLAEVRYRLYKDYQKANNAAEANAIKQEILRDHAGSKYALLVQNQQAYAKDAKAEAEQLYRNTYEFFKKGNYTTVTQMVAQAKKNYPETSLMPKFLFLDALSTGKQVGKEKFKENLNALIDAYPDTDVASLAKNMVALVEQGKEIRSNLTVTGIQQERQKVVTEEEFAQNIQKAGFTYEPDSEHLFICMVAAPEQVKNQVLYAMGTFNFTRFLLKDFDLNVRTLNDQLFTIAVSGLSTLEEALWYQNKVMTDASVLGALQGVNFKAFVISESNYKSIFDKESVFKYLDFYRQNQLQLKESYQDIEEEAGFVTAPTQP